MPIYKNPSMTASNKSNAAGDDHASEAAKVKRTREQAYFNSYDFDAIEALPYDEDEDEDDDRYKMQMKIKQLQKKADIDRGLHTIHNGLIAKFRGLRTQSPLQNQRRHIQRGSLSSATPSSGSSTRSSSLSGNYSLSRNNYAYLQRLGTFLAETKQNGGETTTGKAKLAEKTENAGGHFSLPRPNLQYQSMNNDSVSMPLDANTVTVSSALSSGTTTLMTKTQTIATFPLQSNEYDNSSRSQARLTTKGFPMRAKKDSSSSSTISTDSAIVSANEIDTQKLPTISTLSTKSKPKTKTNSSNSNSNSSRGLSAESEKIEGAVGRYYSTNKSGSSGYYSSNVCSTYSIEDHIYSEPVALDGILDKVHTKSKSVQLARQNRNRTAANQAAVDAVIANGSGSDNLKILKNSRSRNMHGVATGKASANEAEDEEETDEADHLAGMLTLKNKQQQHQQHIQGKSIINERTFNENLRILENSIENLDRHLRNFPSLPAQEHIAGYVQTTTNQHPIHFLPHNLPTIMEGYVPNSQPRSWTDDMADDSLMDIDLDSFLLSNEKHKQAIKVANGIDNPSFLADEQEENNYKCAKYINSCPEDAYRVDSDVVTSVSDNSEQFRQRYEDQVHFENTRELLEDVRDKIRSLSLSSATLMSPAKMTEMPQELEVMIKALKRELENYLARINQHSDREIRQLCTGIVKNQNVVRMTKAFERRRSEYDFRAIPISIRQQITSIRCASDPNFKMKRKSLAEVFPAAESYIRSTNEKSKQQQQQNQQNQQNQNALESPEQISQLQRNLSFHQPMLNHMNSKANISNNLNVNTSDIHITPNGANVGGVGSSESTEPAGDKDSILEWHRKKPSNWEMYYGTNRLSQSLLAAQRTNRQPTNTQATMSYPSSRPESDFTLDLPRAEQLRVKMEKEKKFRNRCRYIVAFLSLMFFLLTVVVVSLVLTRGKRMFGSMI